MASRPNFLIIMSDEHSPDVLGVAGDAAVATPHLDALAAAGTHATAAQCNSPVCVPSRMSFLSGLTPQQIGCWELSSTMRSDTVTWPVALGATGYDTALSGRLHCWWPDKVFGFQQRLCGDHQTRVASAIYENFEQNPANDAQREFLRNRWLLEFRNGQVGRGPHHGFDDDREATDAARAYLRARRPGDNPFALYVGFLCPHAPLRFPDPWFSRYADLPVTPQPVDPTLPPFARDFAHRMGCDLPITPAAWADAVRAYYAMVTYLDALVGELLAELDATGLAEDTVVLYTADHGEMLGRRGLWYKNQLLEPSIRTPFLLRGPGLPVGHREATPLSLLDVYPTLCDMAGAPPPPGLAGDSLLPLLSGTGRARFAERPVFCEYADYGVGQPAAALRRGALKLIAVRGYAPVLYDLARDPGETTDRYHDPAYAAAVVGLERELDRHWHPEVTWARVVRQQQDIEVFRRQQVLRGEP
jgi:choline-sulfatase